MLTIATNDDDPNLYTLTGRDRAGRLCLASYLLRNTGDVMVAYSCDAPAYLPDRVSLNGRDPYAALAAVASAHWHL